MAQTDENRSIEWVVLAVIVALLVLILALQYENQTARREAATYKAQVDKLLQDQAALKQRLRRAEERLQQIQPYADAIQRWHPDVDAWTLAAQVAASSRRWAEENWQVVAWMAVAMGAVESGWQTRSIGRAGERGPLQVMPATARWMGARDLDDWRQTVDAGIRYYVRVCLPAAGRDARLAVAVYNAGPSRGLAVARRLASRHVERVWTARRYEHG